MASEFTTTLTPLASVTGPVNATTSWLSGEARSISTCEPELITDDAAEIESVPTEPSVPGTSLPLLLNAPEPRASRPVPVMTPADALVKLLPPVLSEVPSARLMVPLLVPNTPDPNVRFPLSTCTTPVFVNEPTLTALPGGASAATFLTRPALLMVPNPPAKPAPSLRLSLPPEVLFSEKPLAVVVRPRMLTVPSLTMARDVVTDFTSAMAPVAMVVLPGPLAEPLSHARVLPMVRLPEPVSTLPGPRFRCGMPRLLATDSVPLDTWNVSSERMLLLSVSVPPEAKMPLVPLLKVVDPAPDMLRVPFRLIAPVAVMLRVPVSELMLLPMATVSPNREMPVPVRGWFVRSSPPALRVSVWVPVLTGVPRFRFSLAVIRKRELVARMAEARSALPSWLMNTSVGPDKPVPGMVKSVVPLAVAEVVSSGLVDVPMRPVEPFCNMILSARSRPASCRIVKLLPVFSSMPPPGPGATVPLMLMLDASLIRMKDPLAAWETSPSVRAMNGERLDNVMCPSPEPVLVCCALKPASALLVLDSSMNPPANARRSGPAIRAVCVMLPLVACSTKMPPPLLEMGALTSTLVLAIRDRVLKLSQAIGLTTRRKPVPVPDRLLVSTVTSELASAVCRFEVRTSESCTAPVGVKPLAVSLLPDMPAAVAVA